MKSISKLKSETSDLLETLLFSLSHCIESGMIDTQDHYYNEILGLIDQVSVSESLEELQEVITKAKILETDVAAFLASHGVTSISLPWPKI